MAAPKPASRPPKPLRDCTCPSAEAVPASRSRATPYRATLLPGPVSHDAPVRARRGRRAEAAEAPPVDPAPHDVRAEEPRVDVPAVASRPAPALPAAPIRVKRGRRAEAAAASPSGPVSHDAGAPVAPVEDPCPQSHSTPASPRVQGPHDARARADRVRAETPPPSPGTPPPRLRDRLAARRHTLP